MTTIWKRMLAVLLAVSMVCGLLPMAVLADDGVTEITSLSQITDLSGSYKLTADSEETFTTPLGSFSGTLDGDGHTVTFHIQGNGLFTEVTHGTVKNLTIANSSVSSTGDAGLITGVASGITLTNVYAVNCTVSGTGTDNWTTGVGGLVGVASSDWSSWPYAYATIENCGFMSGSVTKTTATQASVGGIVGYSDGTVKGCYMGGTVDTTGDTCEYSINVGGIVGYNSSVSNCLFDGTIVDCGSKDAYTTNGVGGICGGGYVSSSFAAGTVPAYGYNVSSSCNNCYTLDTCTGMNGSYGITVVDAEGAANLASSLDSSYWRNGLNGTPVLFWMTDSFSAADNAPCSVEYYTENLDGTYYLSKTETQLGKAGETFTVEAGDDDQYGYDLNTEKSVLSGTVTAEGLTLQVYYDREMHTISWNFGEFEPIGEYTQGSVKFGTSIVYPTFDNPGYKPAYEYDYYGSTRVSERPYYSMEDADIELTLVMQPITYMVVFDGNGGMLTGYQWRYLDPDTWSDWGYWPTDTETITWRDYNGAESGWTFTQALGNYVSYDGSWEEPEERTLPEASVTNTLDFAGWFTAAEGGEEVTVLSVLSVVPESDSITLYAHWAEPDQCADGHTLTPVEAVPATCTEDGVDAYYVCSVCGKLFSDAEGTTPIAAPAVIPATGHSWDEGTVTTPATCTEDGVLTYTCTVCGETNPETEAIPALGHIWGEWTDNGDGTEIRTCERCSETETRAAVVTAHVSGIVQGGELNYFFYVNDIVVSSDMAENYGYHDTVVGSVSALDVLVYMEAKLISWSGSVEEVNDNLTINESGWITSILSWDSSPVGFTVNDNAVSTLITQTPVTDGDLVNVYMYRDAAGYMDYYTWFEDANGFSREFTAYAGSPLNLKLKGLSWMFGELSDSLTSEYITDVGNAVVCYAVNKNHINERYHLGTTNSDGSVALTFTTPGTYTITAYIPYNDEGTGYAGNPAIMTLTTINVVAHDEHTVMEDPALAPTCTETGLTAGSHCALCGMVIVPQEEIPALGHLWGEWEIVTEATETEEGLISHACARCGETETEAVPAVECPSAAFTDVDTSKWYHAGVDFMVAHGYMSGLSETEFGVSGKVTRAQLVTILYSLAGKPSVEGIENPFTDVADGKWYTDAILWAVSEGITGGTSATTFNPNDNVTRAQIAMFLYAYAGKPAVEEDHLSDFEDAAAIPAYAKAAMNWAVAEGLISGTDDTHISAKNVATRAQIAVIIMNFMAE